MSTFIRDMVTSDIQLSVREETHAHHWTMLTKIIMNEHAWGEIKRIK